MTFLAVIAAAAFPACVVFLAVAIDYLLCRRINRKKQQEWRTNGRTNQDRMG